MARIQNHSVTIRQVAMAASSRLGWTKAGLVEFVRVCAILNSCSLGKLDTWHEQVAEFSEKWEGYLVTDDDS